MRLRRFIFILAFFPGLQEDDFCLCCLALLQADSLSRSLPRGVGSLPSLQPLPPRALVATRALNDGSYSLEQVTPKSTPARESLPGHLELKWIRGKGFGVVTKIHIPCNSVVGDYVGEVMTTEVKDRRYLESQKDLRQADDLEWENSRKERGQGITGAYLYGVTMPGDADPIYIDAEDEYKSLWTRFLNHASPPGNNVNPKSIHQSYDGNPRVWFVANRDIEVGEELCFDYGDDYWLPGDKVV